MNLTLIPLLLVALVMASADTGLETVQLLVSGRHDLASQAGAVVVADATARVAPDTSVPGPLYVIGGDLVVAGDVAGDIVQLAGDIHVDDSATIDGELRHLGGRLTVSPEATIAQRTSLPIATEAGGGPPGLVVATAITLLLALVAARLRQRHEPALDNVAAAAHQHPVVTLTVGFLAALTFLSVFVFMAFTLVLLPVAAVGMIGGMVASAYGVIALGHVVGARLPVGDPRWATALGVVVVVTAMQAVAVVPFVGGFLALATLLTGLGAVLVTYFGTTRLRLDSLPA